MWIVYTYSLHNPASGVSCVQYIVPYKANKPTLDFFSIRADFAKLLKEIDNASMAERPTLGNLAQRIKNDSFYF